MTSARRKLKKRDIIRHRDERYMHAINKVIDGKAKPSYAAERWKKLREVKG